MLGFCSSEQTGTGAPLSRPLQRSLRPALIFPAGSKRHHVRPCPSFWA